MRSVRTGLAALQRRLNRAVRPTWTLSTLGADLSRMESFVLDLLYAAGAIALFAAIGLVGKAVERL